MKPTRRRFLHHAGAAALSALGVRAFPAMAEVARPGVGVTLFLCGDVMTGRGIDQALPHPGSPRLFEPYMNSARGYVELAEQANGPIPRPVDFNYIWGDGLEALARAAPDARIANLETAVTTSDSHWAGKGIHYRMHPANLPCLTAARLDCCVLANNHVLDWGHAGLAETISVLHAAGIRTAGAGADLAAARAPGVVELGEKGRVLVFGLADRSSGVADDWTAAANRPGVELLPDLSQATARATAARIAAQRRPGDLVVASVHWGSNWGYAIPGEHQRFARALIDAGAADVVHGHSSHHPRALEVYRERLILYGCGDLINDYEGIGGYEDYRADLTLMYFPTLEAGSGRLLRLAMAPMQMKRFRLTRPAPKDARALATTLQREAGRFGAAVDSAADGWLELRWPR